MSKHKRITKDETRALLTRIKLVWQWYVVEDVGVDLWHGALRAYTADQANAGLAEYLKYGKRPPAPADVMDSADDVERRGTDDLADDGVGAGDGAAGVGGGGVRVRVYPRIVAAASDAPT